MIMTFHHDMIWQPQNKWRNCVFSSALYTICIVCSCNSPERQQLKSLLQLIRSHLTHLFPPFFLAIVWASQTFINRKLTLLLLLTLGCVVFPPLGWFQSSSHLEDRGVLPLGFIRWHLTRWQEHERTDRSDKTLPTIRRHQFKVLQYF